MHARQSEPDVWVFVDTHGLHLAPAMSSRLSDKNNVGQRMSSVECLVEKGILHVPSFLWEGVRLATCVLHQETGADR